MFKLTIAVTGNIDLEFPVLAFECFGRVAIPLIIALKITLTINNLSDLVFCYCHK